MHIMCMYTCAAHTYTAMNITRSELGRLKTAAREHALCAADQRTCDSETRLSKAISGAPLPLPTACCCCGVKGTASGPSVRGLIPSSLKPLPNGSCCRSLLCEAPTRDCSARICWEASESLRSCAHARDIPGCWKSPGNIVEMWVGGGGGMLSAGSQLLPVASACAVRFQLF